MNLLLSSFFLAAPAPAANPFPGWMMPVLLLVMFYFLLIRPQQRQRKELAARIASMQAGDRVITTAGIHAIVHHIKDTTVMIKVAEGTILEFDKPSVSTVSKKDSSGK